MSPHGSSHIYPPIEELKSIHPLDLHQIDIDHYKKLTSLHPEIVSDHLHRVTKRIHDDRMALAPLHGYTRYIPRDRTHSYWHAVQAMEAIRPHAMAAHEVLTKNKQKLDKVNDSLHLIDSHPHDRGLHQLVDAPKTPTHDEILRAEKQKELREPLLRRPPSP
jgi:hypothetical protein